MTDEERAREIAEEWFDDPDVSRFACLALQQSFSVIRANEREECAKAAEDCAEGLALCGAVEASEAIRARGGKK